MATLAEQDIPDALVRVTWLRLSQLRDTDHPAFAELVALCRYPGHEVPAEQAAVLGDFLAWDGRPHQSMQAIILEVTEGSGTATTLKACPV